MKIVHKIFGYCYSCNRWFVYPKKRRLNTMFEEDKANYHKVCKRCHTNIIGYIEDMWEEYNGERI